MAISHLLHLKSASHINRIGILRTRVLYSSLASDGNSEKKPHPKKSELAKQQKALAVESFVKKYIKEHQGLFPKPIHVQNEVGGSWHTLKGMLQNIKEKMTEIFPSSTSDTEVSADIPSHKVDVKEKMAENFPSSTSDTEVSTHIPSRKVDIKEKMTENFPSSTSDSEVSTDIPSHKVDDNSGGKSQINEQEGTTAIFYNDKHANQAMPSLDGQSSSPEVVSATALDTSKVNSNSSGFECASKVQNSSSLKHSRVVPRLANLFQNTETTRKESNQKMPSEVTKELPNLVVNKSGYSGYMNLPTEETKMDTQSLLSDNDYEMIQLKHHPVDSLKDQASEGIANTISDGNLPSFDQQSSEPSRDTNGVISEIESLIECVMALPQPPVGRPQESTICNKSDHSSGRIAITGTQRSANTQKFDKKERFTSSRLDQGGPSLVDMPKSNKKAGSTSSLNFPSMVEKNDIGSPFKELLENLNTEDQETSCSKSNTQTEVLSLRDYSNLNKTSNATSSRKESDQNKMIVRFLPKTAVCEDITDAFKYYGDISKVEIFGTEGALFKAAYVYFKSDEGMKKALEVTDVKVRNHSVTVEAASSLKDLTRTYIPDLIGLPDVPTALVKDPKKTVLIMNLAHDIRSHHIEDALSFCKSKISRIFLGSLSTVAYVEFEEEEGKENALKQHSINILGRRLLIFRVDVPRTTVVRISNAFCVSTKSAVALCKSFGKVRHVLPRSGNIMDVHFKLSEWPNMATILNRLNGSEIDGHRLIAQPAPVYPPDVLNALWSRPTGRRHLRSTAKNLLKKLRENPTEFGTAELENSLF